MAGRPRLIENPVNVTIRAERETVQDVQAVARLRGVPAGVLYREALNAYVSRVRFQKERAKARKGR